MNLYQFQCFLFTYTSGLIHFITPLEFYTYAEWINTILSEQRYSQTLTNRFLHFQCLFVAGQAPVSRPLTFKFLVATYENHSCKQSSPETDPFLPPEGVCFTPRVSCHQKVISFKLVFQFLTVWAETLHDNRTLHFQQSFVFGFLILIVFGGKMMS